MLPLWHNPPHILTLHCVISLKQSWSNWHTKYLRTQSHSVVRKANLPLNGLLMELWGSPAHSLSPSTLPVFSSQSLWSDTRELCVLLALSNTRKVSSYTRILVVVSVYSICPYKSIDRHRQTKDWYTAHSHYTNAYISKGDPESSGQASPYCYVVFHVAICVPPSSVTIWSFLTLPTTSSVLVSAQFFWAEASMLLPQVLILDF